MSKKRNQKNQYQQRPKTFTPPRQLGIPFKYAKVASSDAIYREADIELRSFVNYDQEGNILSINQELGITTIVNLHFLDLAKEFGERLIGLKDGELVYDGKVNDVSDQDFENIYGRAIKSSDLLGEDE